MAPGILLIRAIPIADREVSPAHRAEQKENCAPEEAAADFHSFLVVVAVPVNEQANADLKRRSRLKVNVLD